MDAFTSISSFQPDQNLTLTGSVDYFKAKSKAKNDNQRDYQGFTLGSRYVINPEWRIQARIVNLFDKDYETAYLYNQTGRAGYITLRYGI